MGKRVDNILLLHGSIIVLEFKVGEAQYSSSAIDQVLDYALDLKNFHQLSHDAPILPILVATVAREVRNTLVPYTDHVFAPVLVNSQTLASALTEIVASVPAPELDPIEGRTFEFLKAIAR
jgi:hypothetical protein